MLTDFVHAPGRHCATTAISRLLHFHGHALDEAMCLGLSAGLDFYTMIADGVSPSRMIMGRGPDLEPDCFARLGIPLTVRRTKDADEAWRWVKEEIDAGRPALLQADIRWLDYYNTKTHFGGHKILVVGYDEENETALISDNEFPELQAVPLASLARARRDSPPPFDLAHDWFQVDMPEKLTPFAEAVPAAVRALAEKMTADRAPFAGLAGLDLAVTQMPSWGEAPDWQWCARFAYQAIEKRGTGGGAFRLMYAEFLDEAAVFAPDVATLGLAGQMRSIAAAWTDLAYYLREVSEYEQPRGFDKAAEMLHKISRQERDYYRDALTCRCVALSPG